MRRIIRSARGLAVTLTLIALAVLVPLCFRIAEVRSPSMAPTIWCGDRVLFERISYVTGAPSRFDVVLLRPPPRIEFDGRELQLGDTRFVKRVVALPGERVETRRGRLFIDGQVQEDPFFRKLPPDLDVEPVRLGDGEHFVLGDDRRTSLDSRSMGPVHRDDLLGRWLLVVWPRDRIGRLATSIEDARRAGKPDNARCDRRLGLSPAAEPSRD